MLVGYLGEKIQESFGDGSELGITINYSFDGPALLGAAGAIRRALPLLPERFFVVYGDSFDMRLSRGRSCVRTKRPDGSDDGLSQ
jgi:MurNAc alpha-1-phosphate uridylyltransferase